ncbi:spidroin-1-like [Eucalyptus grandis]|uniref:spidroin-1-like n=1 Tax=Eucalyptus grandis TaxID=71139 RepID=UPI00192EA4E3|nr:spidroin-1-like [Eucalyptus grandis]
MVVLGGPRGSGTGSSSDGVQAGCCNDCCGGGDEQRWLLVAGSSNAVDWSKELSNVLELGRVKRRGGSGAGCSSGQGRSGLGCSVGLLIFSSGQRRRGLRTLGRGWRCCGAERKPRVVTATAGATNGGANSWVVLAQGMAGGEAVTGGTTRQQRAWRWGRSTGQRLGRKGVGSSWLQQGRRWRARAEARGQRRDGGLGARRKEEGGGRAAAAPGDQQQRGTPEEDEQ